MFVCKSQYSSVLLENMGVGQPEWRTKAEAEGVNEYCSSKMTYLSETVKR